MKVFLESNKVLHYPGIKIQSETPEEAQRLKDIYCGHGGIAEFAKIPDGNFELCIAPAPETEA